MRSILLLTAFLNVTLCFTQTLVEKISDAKAFATSYLKSETIPGMAISVSINDSIIWSEGFGYGNLQDSVPVTPSKTKFRIGSISKSITAMGLGILIDRNKLVLDSSIYYYVPDFPKKTYDFNIRQIAGHTAGIRHYRGTEYLSNKNMSIVEGLEFFKNDSLLFKPGENFSYSTYGWNLLSVVIQNAAKTEFNTFMQTEVFKPLLMQETLLDVADDIIPHRTQFYRKTNYGLLKNAPSVNNEFKVAGGGFISTSEDLIKFGNEIIHPKLLSQKTRDELVTPLKTNNGKITNYGIGFYVDPTSSNTLRYRHSGGSMGGTSNLSIYPEQYIVIVVVTNISRAPIRKIADGLEAIFIE